MGFENHSKIGLLERASRIALKFGVVYSAEWREFRGAPDRVTKATAALEKWMQAEASKLLRNKHSV